jgi:DNA-binding NarL/FixJ family response regulator
MTGPVGLATRLDPRLESDPPESRGRPADLAELWQRLVEGSITVHSYQNGARHCYVDLVPCGQPVAHRLPSRELEILKRVLLGECPKVLAMDMGWSAATISASLGHSLRRLGVPGSARHLPLFLVVMAHVAEGRVSGDWFGARCMEWASGQLLLIVKRPDYGEIEPLSPGESMVARLLLEGNSHAVIAKQRATSPRTIANQIASVYGKLRVSGRIPLLRQLIFRAASSPIQTSINEKMESSCQSI